jgi:hypothetical protein
VAKKSPQTEGAKAPPPSDIAVLLLPASIITDLLSTAAATGAGAALPTMGGYPRLGVRRCSL